jgi:K+-sensing histidine kinase KdpD
MSKDTVILHSMRSTVGKELDHQRLRWIYEITVELSENQDPAVLGRRFFSKLYEIYRQDQGYMGIFRDDGSLEPVFSDVSHKSLPVSKSIVSRLMQNGESFLLADALGEESLKKEESVLALNIRSALCAPLIYHSQIYGLIYLSRSVPGAYDHGDLEFLRTVASVFAPLVENARLWAEINSLYTSAMDSLKKTQSRLIEMERAAAYVWLAQAIAHEIRNPLMVIGGMVKRIPHAEPDGTANPTTRAIMSSVERIEMVLKEVDNFVKLPVPNKQLERIDSVIQEEIELHGTAWEQKDIRPILLVNTPHLMVPLDYELFRKALSLIFKETLSNVPKGTDLKITIHDCGNDIEIVIGQIGDKTKFCRAFDPALQNKPWGLDLFLNMAHKIVSDQGGSILLDPGSRSAFPMILRLQRIEKT